jgi:acetyl-CoA C-acetyltransferase/acetyl-CoA acyltransferase
MPESVPAVSVHRNCASGFEAITYAYDKAQSNKGDVFVVGGVESMSRAPFLFNRQAVKKFTALSKSRSVMSKLKSALKFRPGDFAPDVSLKLAMTDSLCDMNMGQTAELLAREYDISREEQDEFAMNSHLKASANIDRHNEQIAPFHATNDNCIRSYSGTVHYHDNGIRSDSSVEKLGKLRPVFDRDGSVTAGNSSQVTDGGATLILMTQKGLKRTGCEPIARIHDYAYSGCDPKRMGLGPIHAIDRLDVDLDRMDLIELNEAFAAQVLACQKALRIPDEKLNVNGGAIALGHPLAATGVRLVLNLVNELKHRDKTMGLAALCVGGGQGGAICLQKI